MSKSFETSMVAQTRENALGIIKIITEDTARVKE